MDNEAKRNEARERLNLENMKAMMNQEIQDTKIDQNEELAELRADTTMDKAYLSAGVKLKSDAIKRKDVKTLKGPKR